MSESFERLLGAVGRRIDGDPELRALLGALVGRLIAEAPASTPPAADAGGAPAVSPAAEAPERSVSPAAVAVPAPSKPAEPRATREAIEALVQAFDQRGAAEGRGETPAPAPPPAGFAFDELRQRVVVKLDAVRTARRRAAEMARGGGVGPRWEWFADVIDRARRLSGCFLWMTQQHHERVSADDWQTLESCYTAVLRALDLTRDALEDGAGETGAHLPAVLQLLAEAQSALRVQCLRLSATDSDQEEIFRTLKELGLSRSIFIPRWMRLDDPADPAAMDELLDRIDDHAGRLAAARQRASLVKSGLNRIRYELQRLAGQEADAPERWGKVFAQTDELLEAGLPATDARLAKLLAPWIAALPPVGDVPRSPGVELVLAPLVAEAARGPEEDADDDQEEDEDAGESAAGAVRPEVEAVRRWVAGGSLVLIGGERRANRAAALEEAFGLSELKWIATRPHESPTGFEPAVARDDVRAVLLAIRWSSHSYGEVRQYCEKYGRPLVRLPAGYGVNQVAAQLVDQLRIEM